MRVTQRYKDRDRDPLTGSLLGNVGGPLYLRMLNLKHLRPNAWQRAALVEGMAILGAVLALTDTVSAWAPLALPVAAGVVVKFHDGLTGLLRDLTGEAGESDASPQTEDETSPANANGVVPQGDDAVGTRGAS